MTATLTTETARREERPAALRVDQVRADFPTLRQTVHGHPLVYLDNAATTQKPEAVLRALDRYYREENANVHRGVHTLSERATRAYEGARATVRKFLNAREDKEIVFTRGTTESINLVAQTFGRRNIGAGDEVLITHLEHHSNIVPWQLLCEEKGARLVVVPVSDDGEVPLDAFEDLLSERTRLVSVAHVSNALGTVNPIERMIQAAHRRGVPVLVDGAQAVSHMPVDVQALDADFYAFSGHKVYGPTGIGVLYGKVGLLETLPPWQGGGDMIRSVSFEKTTYNDLPYRLEAGTPHIAGAVGLGAALEYLEGIGRAPVAAHEELLLAYAEEALREVPGLRILGDPARRAGALSFVLEEVHPHDIATILDAQGIAIRAGHHCAQPLMRRFGVPATARASLGLYNTREEIDALVAGLLKVQELFG